SLQRQVRKAVRFKKLRAQVRQAELFLGMARYSALAGDRRALGDDLRDARAAEARTERDVAGREKDTANARESLDVLVAATGKLRDQAGELEATRREHESARMHQGREALELGRRIDGLRQQQQEAEAESAVVSERLERWERERADVQALLEEAAAALPEARSRADLAQQSVRSHRDQQEAGRERVAVLESQLAHDRAAAEALDPRQQDLESRLARSRAAHREADEGLEELTRSLTEAREEGERTLKEQVRAQEALQLSEQTCEQVGAQRREVEEGLREAERALKEAERRESATRARLESLETLQRERQGLEDSARTALEAPGAEGSLAEHLDVPEALEDTVSTVLGGALDYVLVTSVDAAREVLRAGSSRVGVVMIDGEGGAHGLEDDLTGTGSGRAALSHLLPECLRAPDLDAALAVYRETGRPVLSACGVFIDARGVLFSGVPAGAGRGVLARRRQIAELQAELEGLGRVCREVVERVETIQAEVASVLTTLEQVRSARETARNALSEARLAHQAARQQLASRDNERVRHQARTEDLARDEVGLNQALEALEARRAQLGMAITQHRAHLSRERDGIEHARSDLADLEKVATQTREQRVSLESEARSLGERLQGFQRAQAGDQAALVSAQRQVSTCQESIDSSQSRIQSISDNEQLLRTTLETLAHDQVALRQVLDDQVEKTHAQRDRIQREEQRLQQAREQREAQVRQRLGIERKLAEIRTEIEHLRQQVDERYQVSVAGLLDRLDRQKVLVLEAGAEARLHAPSDTSDASEESGTEAELPPVSLDDLRVTPGMLEDPELISSRVEELRATREKLVRIGEVNLIAIDEYRDVDEQYQVLDGQRHDLEESVNSIRHSIAKLNRVCRERLRETFDKVAAIFARMYPELVGGGRARLLLTDEDDLLETGVDIEVQPPGKRLQHLSLLSGGERAMAAIALIFSLFQVKPSPFCLLDEVDAPLDEANGARFNRLLRDMSRLSQFVVITHNKNTMECMDTLYGVTMPEPGVSKLVSVRLDSKMDVEPEPSMPSPMDQPPHSFI
ncbi:MAG: hypothetical protein QGG40_06020, partial [Myxococcota bacterium]|nr:hypothetical protein [Myxococcota bacterium]